MGTASRRLNVQGSLNAVGTLFQPLLFTDDAESWNYLQFNAAGTGVLEHCTMENATYGIYSTSTGLVRLDHATVRNCSTGLYQSDADAELTFVDSEIRENGTGVRSDQGTVTFVRSTIVDNTASGVDLRGGMPVFGSSLTEWNDIHGNGSGNEGRDLGYVTILPFVNAAHDDVSTAVDERPETAPAVLALRGNAPNPFNPATEIRFDLSTGGRTLTHTMMLVR